MKTPLAPAASLFADRIDALMLRAIPASKKKNGDIDVNEMVWRKASTRPAHFQITADSRASDQLIGAKGWLTFIGRWDQKAVSA